jgi:ribosomal protein S27AE
MGACRMKSIKPGRGPSGMSFIGSIVAIDFGVFWTIIAFSITANAPFGIIGIIFPLFGVIFVITGVVQAAYHFKNATGENRFSEFDITDSSEEGDPSEKWVNREPGPDDEKENRKQVSTEANFCPYCGASLDSTFSFCPKCGKSIK